MPGRNGMPSTAAMPRDTGGSRNQADYWAAAAVVAGALRLARMA
jgi:hypothetical protein